MSGWAEREVEIACKSTEGDEWDYGSECYKSALKAYNSLMEDGHSGMSFSITRNILDRLMDRKPLTPITDDEESWNFVHSDDKKKTYQCNRMSSLFKDVYSDGSVKFSDVDRVLCYNTNNCYGPYHNGLFTSIIDDMYPITMPYYPPKRDIKLYCEEFLVDPKNGDFDTQAILYALIPNYDGDYDKVYINRYFKDDGVSQSMVEISKKEYKERQDAFNKRIGEEKG